MNDDGDESEPPTMILQVKYPEAYPDEPPILELQAPRNAPDHPYFDLDADKDLLIAGLAESIEENMGMAMIFTLYSTLKDNAEQLVASRQADERKRHEEKVLALEREENKKFHGTPVTPETFKSWREGFRKEMEEKEEKEDRDEEAAEKKRNKGRDAVVLLTGKQLFERGIVGKGDDGDEDDEDVDDGLKKLRVTN